MGRLRLAAVLSILVFASPASALELTMSKQAFGPDEDIEVFAYNESTRLVSFPSSAPYVARSLDTGEVVGFIGLAVIIPLDPGQRTSFMILGGDLSPGRWTLEVQYYVDEQGGCCETIEFTVTATGGAPAKRGSLGQLKDHYCGR